MKAVRPLPDPLPCGERETVLAVLLLLLSSCSVLFEPSKAPALACPGSAAACPAIPNATATCEQSTCRYSCAATFVDANGDLDAAQTDGCELACAASAPPLNPASLDARVGKTPGEVEWSFPASATPGVHYRLCTALVGAPQVCLEVQSSSCTASGCSVATSGHPNNVRVSGSVIALDACGHEGPAATAATQSATPFDTTSPAGWSLEKSCAGSTSTVLGGLLAIENPGPTCTSSLVAGDELWGDFTLDADFRRGVSSDNLVAGLVFQLNATGHRMSALAAPNTSGNAELSTITQRKNATEKMVAGSGLIGVVPGESTHFRVISKGGVTSFSFGPDEARLVEALRWSDGVSRTGRLGVGAVSTGRAEFTNFRVSTSATLPPRGPTSVSIDFADGGFPPSVRQRVPSALRILPCPVMPPGQRCDGGCVPATTAMCAQVQRQGLTLPNLLVDLPVGIDVREPYSMSLRFAPAPDGGGFFPVLASSTQGNLLAANTWFENARGVGAQYGVVLEPGAWHDATWRFDPDAGRFDVSLDDRAVTPDVSAFPPAGWSPHLGVFSFGEGYLDVYVTDVHISQP